MATAIDRSISSVVATRGTKISCSVRRLATRSAIGHALIDAGYRALFTRTAELVQKLQAARQSLQLPSALAKLDRIDLVTFDERRLSIRIDTRASLALARLARRYAVTQQVLIEQLLIAEDDRVLTGIELDSAQSRAYFADTVLRGNDGDQIEKLPSDNNERAATIMTS